MKIAEELLKSKKAREAGSLEIMAAPSEAMAWDT